MMNRLFRTLSIATAVSLLVQLMALSAPAPTAYAVPIATNEPPIAPHSLTVFPQRDFVSIEGYAEGETVTIELIHPSGAIISTASGLVPQDDPSTPEFDGIVEVNHPGGYCWVGQTPDIRAGDRLRVTVDQTNIADQTTVSNVVASRPVQTAPGTVRITGTAQDALGQPLPLAQIEQRLVAAGELFDRNGRRTLRAPGDGTIAYDAPGSTSWTATYTGLTPDDVLRALSAESRVMWLGAAPAAGLELTIYETGAGVFGGPQAPCSAPLEILPPPPGSELVPPSAPTNLQGSISNSNTVTLTWDAATDNVGVTSYGVYRNGVAIANVQNADGSAPAPTSYIDENVPPGSYTYTVDAADAVGNRSGQSAPVALVTSGQIAPGGPVNEPPAGGRALLAFPSRDFISAEGYGADEQVTVLIIRNGYVVSSASGMIPADGIVEVNHPGGYCWAGVTPELRAGDIVRTIAYDPDLNIRSIDQITVANVTAGMAEVVQPATSGLTDGVIRIRGTAQSADGSPIPIDEIEQRLISSSRDPFELNGRRSLRAPGDGTLSYDTTNNPTGTNWTATYSGLSEFDIQRALSVESRVLWLGRDPLAGIELTLFENGLADPPGPSAGFCSAPLEAADVTAPTTPSLTAADNDSARSVALSWSSASDDTAVYGYLISRDGQPLRYVGASVTNYVDTNVPAGSRSYTVQAFDSASARGPGATIIDQLASGLGQRYGNLSTPSASVTVALDDVSAPSRPANLVATAGAGEVSLTWSPSTDDVGVVAYGIYRDNTLITTTTTSAFVDSGLSIGSYTYHVDAVDGAGNRSQRSMGASANVTAIIDVEAPSIPAAITAAAPDLRGRDILVSWEESTDNVGVTGYTIYRDGVAVATVNGETLSYLDAALPAETYSYTVDAIDSAGNRSAQSAAATEAVANDPPLTPISLIGFPARDFASAEGLADTDGPVVFSLYRDGVLVSSSEPIAPAGGLAEVNHVGGGCWVTQTPDIRPGDILRVTDVRGVPHQTIMAGVQAGRPIQISANTVIIRGTAMDADGDPLPIGEIEQRLVSGGNNFTLSGSRTLRAPGNGTLTYDSPGSTNWTATYTGLSAADLTRAHAAESRIQWLGRNALAGNELTIYENGVGTLGGPEAGFCTAPLEGNVALAGLSATSVAFGDQPAVPATTSAPRAVTLTNAGPATLRLSSVYIGQANPGDFAIASNSCPDSLDSLESCTIQITFTPSAVGARSATLNFLDNAANTSYQTIALTGSGVDAAAPSVPGVPAQALQLSGIVGGQAPMLVSWAASSGPLTSYELQRSANGGAFSSVALAAPTATSQIVMLTPGSSYRFRVRACSGASCSAWATGVNANLIGAQENNAAVKYNGTWTNQAVTGAYGGSVRFGATSGLRATYKATYTRAAWVTTRGPNRGRAQVLIDGAVVATIDLYAPTVQAGQIVFLSNALTANRTHEITILPLGTRNAASTGNRVDVDGFIGIQ